MVMRINKMPKRKYLDLLSNSLNLFLKEMYGDQLGEIVCGYWGLKGYLNFSLLLSQFQPVFVSFVLISTSPLSLFQGHVVCQNLP